MFAIAALCFACNDQPPTETPDVPVPKVEKAKVELPKDISDSEAAALIKTLKQEAAFWEKKGNEAPKDWLAWQHVAERRKSLARLTGSLEEYKKAEKALDIAFTRAPENVGPFVSRAGLNFSLHRFSEVDADLDAADRKIIKNNREIAHLLGVRGDLALQRGDLEGAAQLYDDSIENAKTLSTFARKAILKSKTGQLTQADALLEDALKAGISAGKLDIAWAHLQLGIIDLDNGRTDDALKHFQDADRVFSGWYLIEEHIAECHAIKGELDIAEKMYRDIIARTEKGEFMDALADVMAEKGNEAESKKWRQMAAQAYEKDITLYPSAAYGHALDHYLSEDPARALEFARKNVELRAGPEAKSALVQALIANQQYDEAQATVEEIEQTPWSTYDFHISAYCVATKLNKADRAAVHKEKATALNPNNFEENAKCE